MVRRRTWQVALVALVLIVATVAYGVVAVDRPQVESVENEWGAVTSERTEVRTEVAVDNPFLLRVGDAAADISYTVSLNDVEVATGEEKRVRLAGDESTVTVSTWIDNDEIPAWWASHVANNETTTVRVEPDIVVDYAGLRLPAESLTRTRTVRTDLLEPLATNESRQFQVANRTVFVVNETDAQWGTVTVDRTPIEASATITNSLGVPVPITQIGYTVRLNGLVVGQGVAAEQTVLEPNRTRTLEASAAIDNSKLDEWWVTHRRQGGVSNLTVDFNATVAFGGVERTLPLEFLSYQRQFRTDLFETGNATGNASANESGSDGNGGEGGGQEPAKNGTQFVGSDGASSSRGD
ncbi:LEA type 2 family protein [Natrinema marinum]|uniref:LEA type 2 family protein n=1 Tax=Natrinema marinum TaxID=2961598 RepID=UPI0020C938F3|nr:LEA type 2 family protein [Natrinema marinum]